MARTLTHGARAVRKVDKVKFRWRGREKGLDTLVVKDVLARKLQNVAIEILNANYAFSGMAYMRHDKSVGRFEGTIKRREI